MATACLVCSRIDRDKIDAAAAEPGANLARVARDFNLPDPTGRGLHRHVVGHLSAHMREAATRADRFTAAQLVARYGAMLDAVEASRLGAIDRDDDHALMRAIREEMKLLEAVAPRVQTDTDIEISTASIADYELLRGAVVRVVADKPLVALSLRTWLIANGAAGARLADEINTEAQTIKGTE